MTAEVVKLHPYQDIPGALRKIADDIERGEIEPSDVTVIALPDIYQLGQTPDSHAAHEAVFACSYAINKLMNA